jgi:uncharacterized membrane protein YoaK (UPF0700 family)
MRMNSGEPSIVVPSPAPVLLSFVAGFVDSCTYLALFGTFVAQLTGSFVLIGMQFVRAEPGALARGFAIPCFFLAAVGVTVLVHCLRERPRVALACSLGAEFFLLVAFLGACVAGMPFRNANQPGAIAALLLGITAMGAQSALVRLLMRGVASTNVMTTNTTALAITATQSLLGWVVSRKAETNRDPRYMRAREELGQVLPIILAFLAGTACGAFAYVNLGLLCLFIVIVPVGALALCAASELRNLRLTGTCSRRLLRRLNSNLDGPAYFS